MSAPALPVPPGRKALDRAALGWFAALLVGQWAFFHYLATFYGTAVVQGRLELMKLNRMLPVGYVETDPVRNAVLASHAVLAAVVAFGGVLQLVPTIRRRWPALHRWNGRIFILTGVAAALTGVYLTLRDRDAGVDDGANLVGAVLILLFGAVAWRTARARDFARHRTWALRTFLVVNGVWFQRVGFMAFMTLTGGAVSMESFFRFWGYGSYLVPLAALELYLRAGRSDSPRVRWATTATLGALTAAMSLGIVVFTMLMWRMVLSKL